MATRVEKKNVLTMLEWFFQSKLRYTNDGTYVEPSNITDAIYHLSDNVGKLADAISAAQHPLHSDGGQAADKPADSAE